MAVFSFHDGGGDWQADHLWVGKRVRRTTADGTIVGWDPTGFKDEPPEPLFHVVHDDGDEEDLEEHEAQAAFLAAAAAQAKAYAKAEGLTLGAAKISGNTTGYNGVAETAGGRFVATYAKQRFGTYDTPQEAALARARELAKQGALAAPPMTAAEAVAAAEAEGLTLEPATRSNNSTGYNGVCAAPSGRFQAQSKLGGHGWYATAEEAALARARALAAAGVPVPPPPPPGRT